MLKSSSQIAAVPATFILLAAAAGCRGPINSADVARTSVSVVSVIPFEDIRESLKPKFTISGDIAKKEAIQLTASQQTRELSAVIGEVTAGIDIGATGTAPTSPANQPTATAAPASVAATAGIGTDPFTVYSAANALNQEVVHLNQAMDWVHGLNTDTVRAYVVRLSVAVLPQTREQPYDAIADMTFMPTVGVGSNDVQIIPLLVTESFETIAQQQTTETLRSLAIAISANVGQAKLGGGLKAINDFVADLQARQLNGLMNVMRVGPNSLRVRLGAVAAVSTDDTKELRYRMVPRDHKVSVLILVPRALTEQLTIALPVGQENVDLLRVTTRVSYVDSSARRPMFVKAYERPAALAETRAFFKARIKKECFPAFDRRPDIWADLLAFREGGDVIRFNNVLRVRDVNSTKVDDLQDRLSTLKPEVRPFGPISALTKVAAQQKRAMKIAATDRAAPTTATAATMPARTPLNELLQSDTDVAVLWNDLTDIIAKQSVQTETIGVNLATPELTLTGYTADDARQPLLLDNGTTATMKLPAAGKHLKAGDVSAKLLVKAQANAKDVFIPASGVVAGDRGTSLTVSFPTLPPTLETNGATLSLQLAPADPKLVPVQYLSAKAANIGPVALTFLRESFVRAADGRSSGAIDFKVAANPQAGPIVLPEGERLYLKFTGASGPRLAEGGANVPAAEAGLFPVEAGKTYAMTLDGIDVRTPVTMQVGRGKLVGRNLAFTPLGDPKAVSVVE